ncbi:hypothetical protein MX850_04530 [Erysipelothrix sp. Poltava]|nr:hypothetical protein MX850_04530 [Erysipelothrix sp. Poltava]
MYILDEPTEGIDPFKRDEFIRLLHENIYKQEAIAMISTHNVKGIENLLDYVLYMEKGSLCTFYRHRTISTRCTKMLSETSPRFECI